MYYGTLLGLFTNCAGVLITAIMETEGFTSTSLSGYFVIRNSVIYAAMFLSVWLLDRMPVRPLIVLVGAVSSSAFFLMSFYTRPWQWWISGLLTGIANSTALLLVSVVIKEWFARKRGTFMGLVTMVSGLSAALLNPLLGSLLENVGWRTAARLMGALGLLLLLSSAALIVRRPSDVGEKPWGMEEGTAEAPRAPSREKGNVPFRLGEYLWLLFGAATLGIGIQMTSYLPQYASSFGYSLMVGAGLTSMNMIGNMSAKLLYGVVSDLVGVWRCSLIFYAVNGCGFLLLSLFGRSLPLVYASSLFIGFAYGYGLAQSLAVMERFPSEEYESHYSRLNFLSGLVNLPMPYLISYFYDRNGDVTPALLLSAAFMALGIALNAVRSVRLREKKEG